MTSINPFSDIKSISPAKMVIENVFNKAMKSTASGGSTGISPVTRVRRNELKRVHTCANLFREKLDEIVHQFPNLNDLQPFYKEIIELLIGLDELKKILGSLQGSSFTIRKISREHASLIWNAKPLQAKKTRRAAFSRFKSIILQLKSRFDVLEKLRYELRKLPVFDFENPIIVVGGYPNVGKSSFVKSVTNAKPEIAVYPFTTKNVSIGHWTGDSPENYKTAQIVDTPGLLDRPLKERNDIELKALVALFHLPSLILFILDFTQEKYWNDQLNLVNELLEKIEIPIIIAVNKCDLLSFDKKQQIATEVKDRFIQTPIFIEARNIEEARRVMAKIYNNYIMNQVVP